MTEHRPIARAAAYEASERRRPRIRLREPDDGARSSPRDLSRRDLLKGALAVSAICRDGRHRSRPGDRRTRRSARRGGSASLKEVEAGVDERDHRGADGYDRRRADRAGATRSSPGAPAFDIAGQSAAEAQAQQFGYNNDFVGYHAPAGRRRPVRRTACSVDQPRVHQPAADVPGRRRDQGRQAGPV